jgi:hypothetical protein
MRDQPRIHTHFIFFLSDILTLRQRHFSSKSMTFYLVNDKIYRKKCIMVKT